MRSEKSRRNGAISQTLRRKTLPPADWLALGLITLAALAFFAPVWLMGGWLPYQGGDLASFLWPTYSFAARTLKSGALPLWNPHLYSGAPFWADNQSGILYPPNLLILLLTDVPYQALEALVMFHVWLAGVGMYACLRLISPSPPAMRSIAGRGGWGVRALSPPAAVLGAIVWMLSDIFVTHIGNLNLIAVVAYLPLTFLGVWRGLRDLDWRWALFAGMAFGVGTLAGHAQMSYFTALLITLIGLRWLARRVIVPPHAGQNRWRGVGHTAALLGLIVIVGLGLSAAGWLPALEITAHTARAELSYENAALFSLPPRALIGLAAPWVFGRGPADFRGDWDRVEVGYMGALALILAPVGAWTAFRQRRGWAIFLAAIGITALLAALGRFFPLHRVLYEAIPGFASIRAPARLILFFNFGGAALAALGMDTLLSRRGGSETRPYQRIGWVLPILAAAELIAFGAMVEVSREDPRAGFDHPDLIAWLGSQPDAPFRIASTAPSFQPDTAALAGRQLYDIYGIANPLTLADYHTYYWSLGYFGSPQFDFLGVKYVITDGGPPGDASFVAVYQSPDGLTAWLNTEARPLAMLVWRALTVSSAGDGWARVHEEGWTPESVVYVEDGPPLESEPQADARLDIWNYEANRIVLHIDTPAPAYVVLAEVYYPGWVARIDGEPVPVYRANGAFRAVYADQPGEHVVTFVFRPPLVYAGLAISGVTLAGMVALAFRRRAAGR